MMWNKTIPISEKIFRTSGVLLRISAFFGILPITLRKTKTQVYLKTSTSFAVYGFIIGLMFIILTCEGLTAEIHDGNRSIRIKSHTEIYVMVGDIAVVQMVVLLATFVHPIRISKFLEYIKCLNEVDSIIPCQELSTSRSSIVMLIVVITSTILMVSSDIWMYFVNENNVSRKHLIIERYLSHYGSYFIVMGYEFTFWHVGHSVLRRLEQINQILLKDVLEKQRSCPALRSHPFQNGVKPKTHERLNQQPLRGKSQEFDEIGVNLKKVLILWIVDRRIKEPLNVEVLKLAWTYIKLCDAVNHLNGWLGVTNSIAVIGILWHLIEAGFHILTEMYGKRNTLYIAITVAWCFYQTARLMILVEPCNSCHCEIQRTQSLVSKMLCLSSFNKQMTYELEIFATVLMQSKLEFTAAGLTTLDRRLVSRVMGTITTYLVILVQIHRM